MKIKIGIESETKRLFYVSVFDSNYTDEDREDIDIESIDNLRHFKGCIKLEKIPLKIEK